MKGDKMVELNSGVKNEIIAVGKMYFSWNKLALNFLNHIYFLWKDTRQNFRNKIY